MQERETEALVTVLERTQGRQSRKGLAGLLALLARVDWYEVIALVIAFLGRRGHLAPGTPRGGGLRPEASAILEEELRALERRERP